MAYQFADGFDNYGNNYTLTAGYPWDITPNNATVTSTTDTRFTPPGLTPGGCITNSGSGNVLRKILTSNQSTLIVGFGYKITGLPGASQGSLQEICSFWDGVTEQCALVVNSNGALQFYLGGAAGTAIGTPSANGIIAANNWYGLSLQVTIAPSSGGSVQLYLNGSPTATLNSSAITTSSSGSSFASQVGLGGKVNAAIVAKYDDFYCFDTTGSFLNALPGYDVRILTKMPASAGFYTNWTPTGLASNWQNAAVMPPSISDYNSNNTPNTKDSYTMQTTGLTIAPLFVVARASLTRDDANTHNPIVFVRSGSVDATGTTTPALTSSYAFYDNPQYTDPNTGIAWTALAADTAQVGVTEG